ncbi:MAG: hypothetical protein ACOYMG_15190, partial [Candidatus Methylumidiphilus sp.]
NNDNGTYEPALGEKGINGVVLRLLLCDANGSNCVQASDANGTPIADRATAGGGAYQFTDVPMNDAGKAYQLQILPLNFRSDSNGTKPLYGAVSSYVDDTSAFPWANNYDQGIGITASPVNGILSRTFDLRTLGTTAFGNADFGFMISTLATAPNLEITKAAGSPSVNPGDTLTYTLQAGNVVGAGSLITRPTVLDVLPAGMTVAAGWPAVQPYGWQCVVGAGRRQVACKYTGPLPLAGGASLGVAIQVPVVAPLSTGAVTNTATITKLPGETSYSNNSASTTVTVRP